MKLCLLCEHIIKFEQCRSNFPSQPTFSLTQFLPDCSWRKLFWSECAALGHRDAARSRIVMPEQRCTVDSLERCKSISPGVNKKYLNEVYKQSSNCLPKLQNSEMLCLFFWLLEPWLGPLCVSATYWLWFLCQIFNIFAACPRLHMRFQVEYHQI